MRIPQTVTAFKPRESTKNMASYRREKSFWKELSLIDLDKGQSVANVRFYGAGSTLYCVTWFHLWGYGKHEYDRSCRGMGKAGGYGYHKASAAMQEALQDAGFSFGASFSGVGDEAMQEALQAIAAHIGIARPMIHHAHA